MGRGLREEGGVDPKATEALLACLIVSRASRKQYFQQSNQFYKSL